MTSDADSQDERGWSWGRKANGDEGAQLLNPGQRRQAEVLLCNSAARWLRFLSQAWPPDGEAGEGAYSP